MGNGKGRIALISGASRGVGREIAVALAREGYHLALLARTTSALEETARDATDGEADREEEDRMSDVDPDREQTPLEPKVERIAKDIRSELPVGTDVIRTAVMHEQPAEVRPQEVDQRAVRVGRLV